MAGKRQHIIPRFLQKGFASHIDGEKVFTWAYRKDSEPKELSTKDVFLQNFFYGKENESSADFEITELETKKLSPLCNELRRREDSVNELTTEISEFVAHLAIRTNHLRVFFRDSSERLTLEVGNYISDYENIKRLLFQNPELTKKVINETIDDIDFTQYSEEFKEMEFFKDANFIALFKEMIFPLMENFIPSILDSQQDILISYFQNLFEEIKKQIPDSIKKGHNNLLAENPIPKPRAEDYAKFNWFVCRTNDSLILGDIGCLFETTARKRFKPINDRDETIENIFLPISTNQVLIGTLQSETPDIDSRQLNKVIAECCYEQFICSEKLPEFDDLIRLIGTNFGVLSEEEIQEIIEQSVSDI